ncbi:MAG: hypothetical protein R3C03_22845 [Pirellulaceae bacterium]
MTCNHRDVFLGFVGHAVHADRENRKLFFTAHLQLMLWWLQQAERTGENVIYALNEIGGTW